MVNEIRVASKKIINFLITAAGTVHVAHLKEQLFTARMKKTLLLIFSIITLTDFSCKEKSRSASIQLRQVAESDHPLPAIYFISGPLPDTIKTDQSEIVKISSSIFDKFSTIINRDLPPGNMNKGVVPFFSVTVIQNNISTLHPVDTRETLFSLINQFKRITDRDASITGSGRLDEVLDLLQ